MNVEEFWEFFDQLKTGIAKNQALRIFQLLKNNED